jgi:rubrerythrin
VGLLKRLLSNTSTSTQASRRGASDPDATHASLYPGNETLEVVGESHYQEALWNIAGGSRGDRVRFDTHAVLVPEPNNEYDPNAVKILIEGNLVGYLSREDAASYRPGLLSLMNSSVNGLVALNAAIVGGGQRADGYGMLGVFLDHDPADFGLQPHHVGAAGFRTGMSEAIATDLEDDRYDLSWYGELSTDNVAAIKRLRSMLEAESDPIDRHYMMDELEKRLYRSRDAFSSALEEFDAVCQQHDAEMIAIRPALLEKFGKIPLIGTYRQAAIRCQKAKDWQTTKTWAERGITIYGDQAARPEAVEDLHKRLEYAITKIETAANPRKRKTSGTVVAATTKEGGETELLVCAKCGTTFERVRTRGRKPQACPVCQGNSVRQVGEVGLR